MLKVAIVFNKRGANDDALVKKNDQPALFLGFWETYHFCNTPEPGQKNYFEAFALSDENQYNFIKIQGSIVSPETDSTVTPKVVTPFDIDKFAASEKTNAGLVRSRVEKKALRVGSTFVTGALDVYIDGAKKTIDMPQEWEIVDFHKAIKSLVKDDNCTRSKKDHYICFFYFYKICLFKNCTVMYAHYSKQWSLLLRIFSRHTVVRHTKICTKRYKAIRRNSLSRVMV